MSKKQKAPTPKAFGASYGDLLGGLITLEDTETAQERQALIIKRRVRVSAHVAAVMASHAFPKGRAV